MDWILGTLDYAARKQIGFGGCSQVIFDLEGHLDAGKLSAALHQVSQRFPVIHGKPARDWLNLAPYWKVPQARPLPEIPLKVAEVGENDLAASERLFDDHINEPFARDTEHLRLLLVSLGARRSRLGMIFDHRLLDAFGAETLCRLIDFAAQDRLEEFASRVQQTEPAHLDHWQRRFKSGQTLNRFLRALNERSIQAFSPPAGVQRHRLCFIHDSLTPEQTQAFNARSLEEISIPLALPSAAARALAAIQKAVPAPPLTGEQWLLFTSASGRLLGQEWEKLFFNQFSMMAFTSPAGSDAPPKEIALNLRDQVFNQMKLQIPFVIEDASALARICPHAITSQLMDLFCEGRFCSFYFACLRDAGYAADRFLDLPVTNIIHKPLVFAPPGVNLCMTTFGGRFNLVISYVKGAIADAEAATLLAEFKRLLLQ
jgi:hypothetical protein